MCLICAFVVRICHKQVFSWRGSFDDYDGVVHSPSHFYTLPTPNKRFRQQTHIVIQRHEGLSQYTNKWAYPFPPPPTTFRRCRNHHSLAILGFISVASFFGLLEIGTHFQTLLSSLLKVWEMVLLGTNLPSTGLGEWLSFRRVTSKQCWFWRNT